MSVVLHVKSDNLFPHITGVGICMHANKKKYITTAARQYYFMCDLTAFSRHITGVVVNIDYLSFVILVRNDLANHLLPGSINIESLSGKTTYYISIRIECITTQQFSRETRNLLSR